MKNANLELRNQIETKRALKKFNQEEEFLFAAEIKKKAQEDEARENKKIEEEKQKRLKYIDSLKMQMQEQQKLKKLSGLMSDYEIRQNKEYLKGYENSPEKIIDNNSLPKKIVDEAYNLIQNSDTNVLRSNTYNKAYGFVAKLKNSKNIPNEPQNDPNLISEKESRKSLLMAGQAQIAGPNIPQNNFSYPENLDPTPVNVISQPKELQYEQPKEALPTVLIPQNFSNNRCSPSSCFSRYNLITGQKNVMVYPIKYQ